MKRSAFTLIELLVSIGIIALLIGILLPSLSGAMGAAKRVRCSTNLRSIGQSLTMYMDSGDGLLPYAPVGVDVSSGRTAPIDVLSRVLDVPVPAWDADLGEATRIDPWVCPSDQRFAVQLGTSYAYAPGDFFSVFGPNRSTVTAYFKRARNGVLFLDLWAFHGSSDPNARNAVHWDGSVSRWNGSLGDFD